MGRAKEGSLVGAETYLFVCQSMGPDLKIGDGVVIERKVGWGVLKEPFIAVYGSSQRKFSVTSRAE